MENKLLKESCSNEQKLLEVVLEHNSVLIIVKSDYRLPPDIQPIQFEINLRKEMVTCKCI